MTNCPRRNALEDAAKAICERDWDGSPGYRWRNISEANRDEYRHDALAAILALPADARKPAAEGLVEELRAHVEAADAQVETGKFGPECVAFGGWTWENRHRILAALSTPPTDIALVEHDGERDADEWLERFVAEKGSIDHRNDIAYSADEMIDAFMAGAEHALAARKAHPDGPEKT